MTDLIRRVHGQEVPATGVWEIRPERIQFTPVRVLPQSAGKYASTMESF